ncbi:hypothetical protein AXF42_Ash013855 [Apostasia shenzhenica]|uniref:Uncharacterized protein n=1 Tax=Apostasia shenzhenica TaxID=1088818 RepID=A0A2I0AS19_9ASPA|nr:hypothetical protein AXF42_Ash013855 [Apostasia shenzhenica]
MEENVQIAQRISPLIPAPSIENPKSESPLGLSAFPSFVLSTPPCQLALQQTQMVLAADLPSAVVVVVDMAHMPPLLLSR